MYSRQQLAADIRALGVVPGDVVMVHASVRAVGDIAGGPDEIHLALKDALTANGTLMMYAGCPRYYDEVGRGNLSPEKEAEVLEKLPAFDAATARADQSNGTLVEFLRSYPESRVNHHVARFVVWGKHVARFKVPVRENGVRVWRDMEEFNTAGDGVHANWPDRFFAKLTDGYLAQTASHGGEVGNAECYLMSARGLLDFALPIMINVASGPFVPDDLSS
jgi:aminoglycoside N3'-acetyltransferase